jgi:hypothetical protein
VQAHPRQLVQVSCFAGHARVVHHARAPVMLLHLCYKVMGQHIKYKHVFCRSASVAILDARSQSACRTLSVSAGNSSALVQPHLCSQGLQMRRRVLSGPPCALRATFCSQGRRVCALIRDSLNRAAVCSQGLITQTRRRVLSTFLQAVSGAGAHAHQASPQGQCGMRTQVQQCGHL